MWGALSEPCWCMQRALMVWQPVFPWNVSACCVWVSEAVNTQETLSHQRRHTQALCWCSEASPCDEPCHNPRPALAVVDAAVDLGKTRAHRVSI